MNNPHTKLQAEIQALVQTSLTTQPNLSISIGILQAGQTDTFHFGTVHPPDDRTLYEIGSLTKVFTATLLACLIQEGRVNLDDAVSQHLPDLPNFPAAITLRSLTTHSSGLPRLPRNHWWSTLRNPMNPYAYYRIQDLYAFLRNYRSTKRLGQFEYSNLGFGLLGHVLETVTQTPYEELIAHYITKPLGLTDTTIKLNPDQQQRLIPGYLPSAKPDAKPVANWDLPTLAGAGALRSTLQDVLSFAAANLKAWQGDAMDSLAAAMVHCHNSQRKIQRTRKVDSDLAQEMQIGMGWFIRRLGEGEESHCIYWHDGGTGGYQCYLALDKGRSVAIAVLANNAAAFSRKGFSANDLGNLILKDLIN